MWLRRSDGNEVQRLEAVAADTDIEIGTRRLVFDNRVIVLVRATAIQLASALDVIDDFAELRAAHENSNFFTGLSPVEQAQWVNDLSIGPIRRREMPRRCASWTPGSTEAIPFWNGR